MLLLYFCIIVGSDNIAADNIGTTHPTKKLQLIDFLVTAMP